MTVPHRNAAGAAFSAPTRLGIAFSYAFQPIVDIEGRCISSYEALIRGPSGESASEVFRQVDAQSLHRFDLESRVVAVERAASLRIPCGLNLNFLPKSLLEFPDAIDQTLAAARRCRFPLERLVIEITENEVIEDLPSFVHQVQAYRGHGLRLAIDDFGAGHSGLNLLAEFQPDQIKLDMALVRGIESNGPRQAIVRALMVACLDLGIDIVAEGVETRAELHWLSHQGVQYFQGHLFAKPGFEQLPEITLPL